jgi:ankyrin repeat protein
VWVALKKNRFHQGADVNGGNHEHSYTTLHFAALAGKVDICKILLQHGVKIDRTNSVKRTASQMAAFVGNAVFL